MTSGTDLLGASDLCVCNKAKHNNVAHPSSCTHTADRARAAPAVLHPLLHIGFVIVLALEWVLVLALALAFETVFVLVVVLVLVW